MRRLTHIVVCYWSTDNPNFGMREIDEHYRMVGYLGTPYHFAILRDGTIQIGRNIKRAGVIDHPYASTSINVVLVLPPDETGTGEAAKYTPEQRASGEALLNQLRALYPGIAMEVLGPTRDWGCQ